MVFETRNQEDVIYQDDALHTDEELEAKYGFLVYYVVAQIFFFPFVCMVSSMIMNKSESGLSLTFFIGGSFVYAIGLILLAKFCFTEYEYGTVIKKSMLVCCGQCLVLALFMILFIVYPIVTDVKYSDGDCFRITGLYSLVYAIDVIIQILSIYLIENGKYKEKVLSFIMLLTQLVAIWLYAIIVVPFILKDNNERLIAYGIILVASIILGVINVLIEKVFRKNKRRGPRVVVINSRRERELKIRKEERIVYYREHKKELIVLAVISIALIIGVIVACIIVSR